MTRNRTYTNAIAPIQRPPKWSARFEMSFGKALEPSLSRTAPPTSLPRSQARLFNVTNSRDSRAGLKHQRDPQR
jgi:hypothetical protein